MIFTRLNLRNADNLVHISEDDEWKIVYYGYLVLPFQALVNVILGDMLDKHMIDLCFVSYTHSRKAEKCNFHVSSITFLGSILAISQIKIPSKVSTMAVKQTRRLLGYSNLCRLFIQNFSSVAAPINALTRKTTWGFQWTLEADQCCVPISILP